MTYETILVEVKARTGIITLNRPKALNALNRQLISEMNAALDHFEADSNIAAIILTGSDKAFAAGADIREMKDKTFDEVRSENFLSDWDHINSISKPIIAAVSGFALGGGCELAMACDMLIAGDDAQFGQPEIKIGVMPGAGGTQRLTRAIGKARAMELILTGRTIGADEAYAVGLVTRIVPAAATVDAALELAARIASMPPLAVRSAKRAIRDAAELPLTHGLAAERQAFFALFDTGDRHEGMAAFIEKRPAVWTGS